MRISSVLFLLIIVALSACDKIGLTKDKSNKLEQILLHKGDLNEKVYEAISQFSQASSEQKFAVLREVREAIKSLKDIKQRQNAIVDVVRRHGNYTGWADVINKAIDGAYPYIETLMAQPIKMPVDVYRAIESFGGKNQFISAKNAVIPEIRDALLGKLALRDAAIRASVGKHGNLTGLAEEIIDLLPKIPVLLSKPSSMPTEIYDAIKEFGGIEEFVAEKNAVISEIRAALVGMQSLRNAAIRASVGKHKNLRGLAEKIIDHLPKMPVLRSKPATMSDEIYRAIKEFGGIGEFVAEKNGVISVIDEIINRPLVSTRDQAIVDAISAIPSLAGLDNEIIKQLIQLKNSDMPQDVYDDIVKHNGVNKHIREKNELLQAILKALQRNKFNRDRAIRAAVAANALFTGIDATIIAQLPPIALPTKPADMNNELYMTLLSMERFDKFDFLTAEALERIQKVLRNTPDFGGTRDTAMRTELSGFRAKLVFIPIREWEPMVEDIVRIINTVLVPITKKNLSGLTKVVYEVIIGTGLSSKNSNHIISDIASVFDTLKDIRDAMIDATLTINGAAVIGVQVKNAVDQAQFLMPRPVELAIETYDLIFASTLSNAHKNVIAETVAEIDGKSITDFARKALIRDIVAANGGNDIFAEDIANSIKIESKYQGVLLPPEQGSGVGERPYYVVRVTAVDPDSYRAAVGDKLFLHPDKYEGKMNYGDTVYFNVPAGSTVHPSVPGFPKDYVYPTIKTIASFVGFRRGHR